MKYDILINNIRRVDSLTGAPVICRVGVKDGRIAAIIPRDRRDDDSAETVIEGRGRYILPDLSTCTCICATRATHTKKI